MYEALSCLLVYEQVATLEGLQLLVERQAHEVAAELAQALYNLSTNDLRFSSTLVPLIWPSALRQQNVNLRIRLNEACSPSASLFQKESNGSRWKE